MLFIILVIIGFFVGMVSAFFGVGGGVIMVPAFYFFFPEVPAQTVISTSLAIIFVNSLINLRSFKKQGLSPRWPLVFKCAVSSAVGVILSSMLALKLDTELLKYLFAGICTLIVLRMLLQKIDIKDDGKPFLSPQEKEWPKSMATGFGGGIIAGLTGLGGGAVIVPLLLTLFKLPYRWVSVHSNAIMAPTTLVGLLPYLISVQQAPVKYFPVTQIGYVNFGMAFFVILGSFFGSPIGVRLDLGVSERIKKLCFMLLLSFISLRIFLT